MHEKTCQNCAHYSQHYALDHTKIFRVYCGHCKCSRPKRKLPDGKACDNFVPGSPDTDAFVSKDYLSKELLEYMFSLDLLPEIEEFRAPSSNK